MQKRTRLFAAAVAMLSFIPFVRAEAGDADEGSEPTISSLSVDETAALLEAVKLPGKSAAAGDTAVFRCDFGGVTALLMLERPVKPVVEEAKPSEKAAEKPRSYQTYTLLASWSSKATLERVNEWNSSTKWSKAWLNSNGAPVLQSDFDLSGGATAGSLVNYFNVFQASVPLFQKRVVDPKPAAKAPEEAKSAAP